MKKSELLEVLEAQGISPGKDRGQNFLIDENLLNAMVGEMDLQPGEKILEIGPGLGVLTRKMLAADCKVTAVEIDRKIQSYLESNIEHDNFTLVKGDACRVDYKEILDLPTKFRCLANLPYAISSIFVSRMLELESRPDEMFFLVQKEMAERLAAPPNCKSYGYLSVRCQSIYDIKILRKVPPSVFHPPPKVDSAFISLKLKSDLPANLFNELSRFSKCAFSQRRKKAIKLCQSILPKDRLLEIFEELEINPDARAENISVEQYLKIAKVLAADEQ